MLELYTDAEGKLWEVVDFKIVPPGDKKRRLPVGHHEADGRAFWRELEGPPRIYWFGKVAYRDVKPKTLAAQLENARPATQSAARQFWDRST
jgi:hypothetical protein